MLTSLSKLRLPKDKGKYLDKFAKTVRVYCIVVQAVKKFAAFAKINLKIAERFNYSFQSNYLEQEKSLTSVQAETEETDKSEKINPALPISDMAHLLDLNPRLERSRH